MKICICGGGSLGHVCAGVLGTHKDVEVSIYTGHPEQWQATVSVTDSYGKSFVTQINKVSSIPKEVISGQDIILFCVPGFLIEKTLLDIRPFIGEAFIGTVVSSTGFFFFAHQVLGPKAKLFGFQRVPYIARVKEYGSSASLLGYKPNLAVAIEGTDAPEELRKNLERLFITPVSRLDNYLEASLTNSNPILHTGRLYSLFKGKESFIFDHHILFYKEWTDEASELLIKMDREFFQLLNVLKVTSLPTLLEYYECNNASSLTKKIQSIPAFQSILCPMLNINNGWMADFKSRYFTEDFPFGLRWIHELANKHFIKTPFIDDVYEWGIRQLEPQYI